MFSKVKIEKDGPVDIVRVDPGNHEQLAEVSAHLAKIGDVVALLHLSPLRLAGVGWETQTQEAHLTSTTHGLFGLLKSLDSQFSSIEDGTVMSVSAMDGRHGNASSRFNALAAGAHGIIKSYAKEKPHLRCRAVDIDPELLADPTALAHAYEAGGATCNSVLTAQPYFQGEDGHLKAERGVHRLVRQSPFDASNRRHTSFARVDIVPVLEDNEEIAVSPDEIRTETFRSSGAGGQHVNKTDSAVRITHIPSNIVVSCQNQKSQHQNREVAMQVLQARLLEKQIAEREAELARLRGESSAVDFGSQIRSYVLDSARIKDLRTNIETTNTQSVLDGDLDKFIEASLKMGF